jgi:hypothetical protein
MSGKVLRCDKTSIFSKALGFSIFCFSILLTPHLRAQQSLNSQALNSTKAFAGDGTHAAAITANSAGISGRTKDQKRELAREELPRLLRAVFNSKWNDESILLTVNAAWQSDSLVIEYNYYRGVNVLLLDDKQLVENIVFLVKPGDLDVLETESDEFLFLYLRNKKKISNIHSLSKRPVPGVFENNWCSSLGFPVRMDNLPMIIQYLKDLRKPD